ncbi:hypothetical protein BDN72DRAFT_251245 [Pluteus cervinus]|uniref:Uncharacterized protein n=1 Tax=Pluteus cervinus TaxID=181527 RepID=A0ACD3AH25_9AGAR|nr:hypothetical protein BDN72DRAFT_251245 [Pluteus cervinus]
MNKLGLRILVLAILPVPLCFAQEQSPSFRVLDNAQGETPCTVQGLVQKQCQPAVNLTSPAPTPTQCTCNLVFFNLWSACILSSSTSTLPQLDSWKTNCTTGSLSFFQAIPNGYQGGVQLPRWVDVPVRTDTQTFDVAAAITVADVPSPQWTTLQKVTPVIVGVSALIMVSCVFICWRRRSRPAKTTLLGLKHSLPFVSKAHKVTERSRQADWDIEGSDKGHSDGGSIRLEPSPLKPTFVDLPFKPSKDKPSAKSPMSRKSLWKRLQLLDWLETGMNHVPLPWRRRPQAVKSMARSDRFRVDDVDASTMSSSSRRATMQSSRKAASEWSAGQSGRRASMEGTEYDGRSRGSRTREGRGERETLISHDERNRNSVFLISTVPGVDFSLESNASDQASAMLSPSSPPRVTFQTPEPQHSASPRLRIPPAPQVPVPLPPILSKPPKLQQPQPSRARASPPPLLADVPSVSEPGTYRSTPTPPPHRTRNSPPMPNGHRPFPIAPSLSSSSRPNLPRPPLPRIPSPPAFGPRARSPPPIINGFDSDDGGHLPSFFEVPSPPYLTDSDDPNQNHHHLSSMSSHSSLRSHIRQPSNDSLIPHRLDPVMLFPGPVRSAGYAIGTSSRA